MRARVLARLGIVALALAVAFAIWPRTDPTPPPIEVPPSIPGVRINPETTPTVTGTQLQAIGTSAYPRLRRRQVRLKGLVNGMRTTRDLRSLRASRKLSDCAQRYAREMSRTGVLAHTADACGGTRENVGMGPNLGSIHRALWGSRPHRINLLCACRRVGVGAARDDDGFWWVVQAFR